MRVPNDTMRISLDTVLQRGYWRLAAGDLVRMNHSHERSFLVVTAHILDVVQRRPPTSTSMATTRVEIVYRRAGLLGRGDADSHRVHTTHRCFPRTTTFQSVSSSSIIASTPKTLTALTCPVPICLIPISHTSNGSLSPG